MDGGARIVENYFVCRDSVDSNEETSWALVHHLKFHPHSGDPGASFVTTKSRCVGNVHGDDNVSVGGSPAVSDASEYRFGGRSHNSVRVGNEISGDDRRPTGIHDTSLQGFIRFRLDPNPSFDGARASTEIGHAGPHGKRDRKLLNPVVLGPEELDLLGFLRDGVGIDIVIGQSDVLR